LVDKGMTFDHEESRAFIGLEEPKGNFDLSRIFSSIEEYARSVFSFFRECDARGIKTIYCQSVEVSGIGDALMDRLRRAAED